jgi:hypothetical protein
MMNITSYRIISKNILEVRINNPNKSYSDKLLQITYMVINYTKRMLVDVNGIDLTGEYIGVL